MAFLYVPNGIHMRGVDAEHAWHRIRAAIDFAALAGPQERSAGAVRLDRGQGLAERRWAGDHARAMGAFLTGVQPRKTAGAGIRAGISVDQVAAGRIGQQTRLPSLEIGCDPGAMAGNCDSGYSCVYSSTISWRSATTPMPKMNDPRQIFDRLFGNAAEPDGARRVQNRRSIIDFVREDAEALQNSLGANDRRKLDEYFAAIRDIEQRIQRAEAQPPVPAPNIITPAGIPNNYQEHIRILAT